MAMIKEVLKGFYQQIREEFIFGWLITYLSLLSSNSQNYANYHLNVCSPQFDIFKLPFTKDIFSKVIYVRLAIFHDKKLFKQH